jgi:hypothetical protein
LIDVLVPTLVFVEEQYHDSERTEEMRASGMPEHRCGRQEALQPELCGYKKGPENRVWLRPCGLLTVGVIFNEGHLIQAPLFIAGRSVGFRVGCSSRVTVVASGRTNKGDNIHV